MQLTIETVTRTKTVTDVLVTRNVAAYVDGAPYRIGKRASFAYGVGLRFVKALGDSAATDTPYIAVVDSQRRILASWRAMPDYPGYTGTHDKHPLIGYRGIGWRK